MKVLVCGGRDFRDSGQVHFELNRIHSGDRGPIKVLIHGAARGADTIAADWARAKGGIKVLSFPADWQKHGLAAGPLRNQQMLDEGKPDLVVAFPGGKGTADMVRRAVGAFYAVREVGK